MNDLASTLLAGVGPMAIGGPLGAAAKTAISGAPKMTAAVSGLLGAGLTPSGAAGPEDIAGPGPPGAPEPQRGTGENWWRTKRTPMAAPAPFEPPSLTPDEAKTYEIAPKPADWDRPRKGVPLSIERKRIADTREQDISTQNKRTAAVEKKVADAQKQYEEAQRKSEEAYNTEQARLDKLDAEFRKANESITEQYPGIGLLAPIGTAAVTSRVPYSARKAAQKTGGAMVDQMMETIARARGALSSKAGTPAQRGALAEVESQIGNVGKMPPTDMPLHTGRGVGNMVSGAATGAELNVAPLEIDWAMHKPGGHGREEASNPMNWLARGGLGALTGALGARYGGEMALGGKPVIPPTAELQGLKAALTPAPKKSIVRKPAAEDEVARQLRLIQQATNPAAKAAIPAAGLGAALGIPDDALAAMDESTRNNPRPGRIPTELGGGGTGGGGVSKPPTATEKLAIDPYGVKDTLAVARTAPNEAVVLKSRINSILYDSRLSGAKLRDDESMQRVYKDGGASLRNALSTLRERLKEITSQP